jgi:hypothetical protein
MRNTKCVIVRIHVTTGLQFLLKWDLEAADQIRMISLDDMRKKKTNSPSDASSGTYSTEVEKTYLIWTSLCSKFLAC